MLQKNRKNNLRMYFFMTKRPSIFSQPVLHALNEFLNHQDYTQIGHPEKPV